MDPRVTDVFVAPEGSAPMERRESVAAVDGGLRGDRYCRGNGHYAPYDVCEVTAVDGAALDRISEAFGIDLSDGRHRRNLVLRGVDLEELLGATVRVGEARLRGTRQRPPCPHVEELAGEDGVASALKGRGGICADVVEPGRIAVGDPVAVVEPDPRTAGASIADRLADDGE